MSIKYVLVIAAAVVAIYSCKKEDPAPSSPPPPVQQQDTIAPVITISVSSPLNHTLNAPFTVPAATAYDSIDGDLTQYISVNSTLNVNLAGTYSVIYSVMDSDSNMATATLIVNVVNTAGWMSGNYWNCDDTCQISGTFSYFSSVSPSSTINGAISINNFAAFGTSISISAYVSGSALSFPSNQPIATYGTVLNATGTITSTVSPIAFNVVYTWTDGVTTESCTGHYSQ